MTQLPIAVKNNLIEAKRRYVSFHAGKDALSAWTGLGYPSDYKQAVELGYMLPVNRITPKVLNWYKLTEKGLAYIAFNLEYARIINNEAVINP